MAVLPKRLISLLVLVVAIFVQESHEVTVAEDVTLTAEQKTVLEAFKAKMIPQLKQDYQHSDIYLIRWLRAKHFNLGEAEQMLLQNINWRKEQHIDHILNEDNSESDELYPYEFFFDKEGKPVFTVDLSDWDFRKSVLAGKQDQLLRQFARILEQGSTMVRKLQKEGKEMTRFSLIASMKGFNVAEHACFQCVSLYPRLVGIVQNQYPEEVDKMINVDVPAGFQIVLNVMRGVMSPETRKIFTVYGTNRKEWTEALLKDIEADQLPKKYGGNRI